MNRLEAGGQSLLMYPADELEAGPANLYLRIRDDNGARAMAMLGPGTGSTVSWDQHGPTITGSWLDLQYTVRFRLAEAMAAWYWHVCVKSLRTVPTEIDLIYGQDLALAPYNALRMCEYYVSQYLDITPVDTSPVGTVLAIRQNMPGAAAPWAVIGCLSEGMGWGTDALQLVGRAHRAGAALPALALNDLASARLQHEHTLALLQARPMRLAQGESVSTGFFGAYQPDHPEATSSRDTVVVDEVLAQPEAQHAHPGHAHPGHRQCGWGEGPGPSRDLVAVLLRPGAGLHRAG